MGFDWFISFFGDILSYLEQDNSSSHLEQDEELSHNLNISDIAILIMQIH